MWFILYRLTCYQTSHCFGSKNDQLLKDYQPLSINRVLNPFSLKILYISKSVFSIPMRVTCISLHIVIIHVHSTIAVGQWWNESTERVLWNNRESSKFKYMVMYLFILTLALATVNQFNDSEDGV